MTLPDCIEVVESRLAAGHEAYVASRYMEARRHALEAQRVAERLGEERLVAAGCAVEAEADFVLGDYERAESLALRALAVLQDAPDNVISMTALGILGRIYSRIRGDVRRGEALQEQALALAIRCRGPDHPDTANVVAELGELAYAQGRYAEADRRFTRAWTIYHQAGDRCRVSAARVMSRRARICEHECRYADAEVILSECLAVLEEALGPDHHFVAYALSGLAHLCLNCLPGRHNRAEQHWQRALAILERTFGPDHADLCVCLDGLGCCAQRQGNYALAEQFFQRSLRIVESVCGPVHRDRGHSLANLALLSWEQGRLNQADRYLAQALDCMKQALGSDHPQVTVLLGNRARLLHQRGRLAEARRLYQRALALREEVLGADHPQLLPLLEAYAELLYDCGDERQAQELAARADAIRAMAGLRDGPSHGLE